MRRTSWALAGFATLGLLAMMGCAATTKITNVWTDPTFQTNSLKKLVVIGIAPKSSVRRVFEDTFAAALKGQGVEAVPSYTLVGDGPLDSVQVNAKLQESGCDGVLITRLVDKKTVDTYYPPTTSYVGAPGAYYGGWNGYYSMGYSYAMEPGYTVQNQVINLETNLYRVSDSKLVWSALSQSWLEQAAEPATEIKPYVEQLVYTLGTSKVVIKTKK